MWGGYDGWGWGLGMVHGLLWWVLVILGIIVLVRLLGRSSASAPMPHSPAPVPETALEILKRRYANGEIGKAEFEEKKRDLS